MVVEAGAERRGLLPRYTLKAENLFLVADARGDIHSNDDGLFADDTRMLSRFELFIAEGEPSLLGASVERHNTVFTAHLTNRPLPKLGEHAIPRGVIHIARSRLLHAGRLYEQVRCTNYGLEDAVLPLRFAFAADFADIFEVQGQRRSARGEMLEPECHPNHVSLGYQGLDGRLRVTTLAFSLPVRQWNAQQAHLELPVSRGGSAELFIEVGTLPAPQCPLPSRERLQEAVTTQLRTMHSRLDQGAVLSSSGRLFSLWIDRSRADLALLTTALPTGAYPYAGIPWFATPFGRDALITALQTLWINPALAAGVLRFLAATQATETDPVREAEPGKILHEMRHGEMAALREVPFGRYYGSVDSTPLFVTLAGSYESRTGDRAVADEIWPALQRAVTWIERRLDSSRSGFLDYRGSSAGLTNQAWKDSADAIFHLDGSFPEPPVAVVEVQGYAYLALSAMAALQRMRGNHEESARLTSRARSLREAIEECFWIPERRFYGIAIDGAGRLCQTRASNAGQLLFGNVPSQARARQVIRQLLAADFRSGWGIRTLAAGEARFNPMSYHNGSVWPHDTALCAAGMANYGHRRQVVKLLGDVFEAATHFDMRLPELYCGFHRVAGESPTPYPVACLPQAWAAGAPFMLLQACLGLRIDGIQREIHVDCPQLPIGIEGLTVHALPIGEARVSLRFFRDADQVMVAAEAPREIAVRIHARGRRRQ
jgi:glycogen debranching enzyme